MKLTKEQLQFYKDIYLSNAGIKESEFDDICDELIEYKKLEEQIDFPKNILGKDILERATNGIWVKRETINCGFFCEPDQELGFMQNKENHILMLFDFTNRKIGFLNIADGYELWFVCWVNFKDYKKTWWLKRDKSE